MMKKKAGSFVSVVIVNFNGRKYLTDCIESLYGMDYPQDRFELILVDNGSVDGSLDLVRSAFPSVRIVENGTNNYCQANNRGLACAKGSYVAFLNNDTRVDRRWLAELIAAIEEDETIGQVGSKILLPDGRVQNAGHIALADYYWAERGFGESSETYTVSEEVESLCGAAVLYRTDIIKKAGPFDEDFIMYMEDVDMSRRIRSLGYKAVFVPSSVVYHVFHGTCSHELSREFIERNRLLFIAKHDPAALAGSLIGRGHFTAKHDIDSLGRMFGIMPDVIVKLHKHHPGREAQILGDVLRGLEKVAGYENRLLAGSINKLTHELGEKHTTIEGFEADIRSKAETIKGKDRDIAEKNRELSDKNRELSEKNRELSEKSRELSEKNRELSEKIREISEMTSEISRKTEEISAMHTQLADAHAAYATIETEFALSKKDLDEQKKMSASLHETLLEAEQKIFGGQNDLRATKARMSALEAHLVRVKEELRGIYSSEGFRFILRPIWTVLWMLKILLKRVFIGCRYAVYVIKLIPIAAINLFVGFLYILEYTVSKMIGPASLRSESSGADRDCQSSLVSVVIPNFNGAEYLCKTLPALYGIKEFKDGVYEVVVVDDASTDDSRDYIHMHFPQVRFISNRVNQGFGRTCNIGVRACSHDLVLLLNNDVIVTEGFLAPLVRHFANNDVFAVSPRIYTWDGSSFATGAYVGEFSAGYVHMWNESDVSLTPVVERTCQSIFAIGCAVLLRKKDYIMLSGFDPLFAPYSWEDIDISYRALKRGMRVLYEPESVVYHKVHGTIGEFNRSVEVKNELTFMWKNITDPTMIFSHFALLPLHFLRRSREINAGIKGYYMAIAMIHRVIAQRIRERRYARRSDSVIFASHSREILDNSRIGQFDAAGGPCRKTVLVLTPYLPYPLKSGGQVKLFNNLKRLSQTHDIILLSFILDRRQADDVRPLRDFCREVIIVLRESDHNRLFDKMEYPVEVKYFYTEAMRSRLQECVRKNRVDLVQIEYGVMALYAQFIPGIRKVLIEHDVSMYSRNASYLRPLCGGIFGFLDWINTKRYQKSMYGYFDKIVCLSDDDRAQIVDVAGPEKIDVVPIAIEVDSYRPAPEKGKTYDMLFVGHMLHYPNVDGLRYFMKEVFPRIKKDLPHVTLCIVGSNTKEAHLDIPAADGIDLVGEVEDVNPYFMSSRVSIVPIRLGAGLKVKILESMAMEVPVVATAQAARGLNVTSGREMIIADTPDEFSAGVISLLRDDPLRSEIGRRGRAFVQANFSSKAVHPIEQMLYRSLTGYSHANCAKQRNPPLTVAWDITFQCNYRCPYCFNTGNWEQIEMEKKYRPGYEWLRFWDSLYGRYGSLKIIISGGEPFFYPDFIGIARSLSMQHSLEICTNLSVDVGRIVDEFRPKRISLHPSYHPYHTDPDVFLSKLDRLKAAGWDFNPSVVAYPPLLKSLREIQLKFREHGFELYIIPFIGQWHGNVYPAAYTREERNFIFSISGDRIQFQVLNINPSGLLCSTGHVYIKVYADGQIVRCASSNTVLGSIDDGGVALYDGPLPCTAKFCICNNEAAYAILPRNTSFVKQG
ncbi:MAG TPA: glycosyltransferase [Candidatus Omnitrophota bacterium]|nr:glycosyltransferase [Candidatus Omnitrophota bacterium]